MKGVGSRRAAGTHKPTLRGRNVIQQLNSLRGRTANHGTTSALHGRHRTLKPLIPRGRAKVVNPHGGKIGRPKTSKGVHPQVQKPHA